MLEIRCDYEHNLERHVCFFRASMWRGTVVGCALEQQGLVSKHPTIPSTCYLLATHGTNSTDAARQRISEAGFEALVNVSVWRCLIRSCLSRSDFKTHPIIQQISVASKTSSQLQAYCPSEHFCALFRSIGGISTVDEVVTPLMYEDWLQAFLIILGDDIR